MATGVVGVAKDDATLPVARGVGSALGARSRIGRTRDRLFVSNDRRLSIRTDPGRRHLTIAGQPARAESTRAESTRAESTRAESTRTEAGRVRTVATIRADKAGTAQAGTAQAGTAQAGTAQAGTAQAGTAEAGAASLRVVRAAGLSDVVRPASEHASRAAGVDRVLPVLPELAPLLPGGGLRRGSLIAVRAGVAPTSLMLALLAAASQNGSWCGVVGIPTLGLVAAAEVGIVLDRLALVPHPGAEWATVVAALLDGLDIVVTAPPRSIAPSVAGRLAARARQRSAVLMAYGSWHGADVMLEATEGAWDGLGEGRGRLRWRELTVRSVGRGAASVPRQVRLWLPGPRRDRQAGPSVTPSGTVHTVTMAPTGTVRPFRRLWTRVPARTGLQESERAVSRAAG